MVFSCSYYDDIYDGRGGRKPVSLHDHLSLTRVASLDPIDFNDFCSGQAHDAHLSDY